MTQSVELVLDPATDGAIRDQWDRLSAVGLPSARRDTADDNHRPHVTLYAAPSIPAEADSALPGLLAGLDLELTVGSIMVFGPRRGSCVLVRQVVPSAALLALQNRVAELCGADPAGQFASGGWSPHVTLAPRLPVAQLSTAVQVLADTPAALLAQVIRCRRWDGDRKVAWWLTD